MNEYRTVLEDNVSGLKFNFAVYYKAKGLLHTERQIREEFPIAKIIKIEWIK